MAALTRPDLIQRLPGWGAASAGALVGLALVAMPIGWLEGIVQASGVAALLPVAEPPLGGTARAVLALGGGALAAAIAWAALYLLFGPGGLLAPRVAAAEGAPVVRRADAHPDAPPRRPLMAGELDAVRVPIGAATVPEPVAPMPMAAPNEQAVPADLDTPLSALDPRAIPAVPLAPVRALAPLAPGERLQTFSLAPPPPSRSASVASEAPSIEALLRRLEQGAGRRVVAR